MRKSLLVLTIALGLIASPLHSAPFITPGHPAYDPFADASGSSGTTYTPGAFLIGQTNSQGLSWAGAGTSNSFQPIINSGNLSVTGLAPSTGNSVSYGPIGSAGDTARLGLGGAITTNTVYYSFALQVTNGLANLTAPAIVAGFNNSTGTQTGQPGVITTTLYLRQAGAGYNVGVNKGTTVGSNTWDATDTLLANTTVFLVGSYTFNTNSGTDDVSALWVNPDPSTFGTTNVPTPTITNNSGNDITSGAIASFLLRQGSALEPNMVVDDIRVGVTWADVTPLPASSLLTPAFANLTASPSTKYATAVALSGTVVATGPVYPAMGESVNVSVNGVHSLATITDTTGDFTINFNPGATPVSVTPYTITYAYGGDLALNGATNTSTSLLVNAPLAVTLAGNRPFDGTANVAAGTLFVANAVSGDAVTVSSGSGTLTAAGPGAEAITSFGTLTLAGSAATNYTLSGATGSVTITSPFASAGHPIFEPFNNATSGNGTAYNLGDNLVGETNAQGVGWFAAGNGVGGQPFITSGPLTYPGLLAASTNSITYAGVAGITARMNLGTSSANWTFNGGSAYTVYYSMLFQVSSLGTMSATPAVVAGFNNSANSQSTQPTTIAARLYTRLDGSGYDLGINKSSSNTNEIVWEPTTYSVGTTYFLVAAYNFSGTPVLSNDTASLWVDPSSTTFGSVTAPAADVTTSLGNNVGATSATDSLASFLLRSAATAEPGSMIVDELSIGTKWADVTPTTASATFSITSAVASGNDFIMTWQSTPGSVYQVISSTNLGLSRSNWAHVGTAITATGTSTSATNPISLPINFYSVATP